MNIVGEGFPKEITKQIETRQSILGSANKTNEQLVWMTNKTGWVRMVSSVDLKMGKSTQNLTEDKLARNFILHGGVEYNKFEEENNSVLLPEFQSINNKRGGVWQGVGNKNSFAYGIGGTDFGLRPMMGITSAEIKTETRGSLKTATIQVKAFNKEQFDIIDSLYMRLGFSMLLEWGHSTYYDNNSTLQDNKFSLAKEFLNGIMTYENHLEKIKTSKLNSNGNYDAIVGKVVNFNWTFEKDMSYTITITLRSMGDVIESLKANILLPKPAEPVSTTASEITEPTTSEEIIKASKESHEIGRFFNSLMEQLGNGTRISTLTSKNPKHTGYNSSQESVVFFGQSYENLDKQYYIKLARFLAFLEETIIPSVNEPSVKLLKINNRVDSNFIFNMPYQISSNIKTCNFKWTGIFNDITYNILDFVDDFVYTFDTFRVGKLMNMYVNVTFILNIINDSKDKNGVLDIYSLLKNICNGINKTTGNVNSIEPTINENVEVIFVDKTPLPGRDTLLKQLNLEESPAVFNVYKLNENIQGSFIRDFNFNTTITNSLATMITVGATSKGYMVGEDATALSRMNKDYEDRFKKKIENPTLINTVVLPQNSTVSNYKQPLEFFEKYTISIASSNQSQGGGIVKLTPKFNDETVKFLQNTQNQLYEYYKATETIESQLITPYASSPTISGFLPFDLQLSMEGLSGFKIYQKYTINSEFLPSNYPESLEFIVKGITHKINNNEWTTTVESIAIPKQPKSIDTLFGQRGTFNTVNNILSSPIQAILDPRFTPNANKLRQTLQTLGYKEKKQEISSGGDISEKLSTIASKIFTTIKNEYPNISVEVTGGNDLFHANLDYNSRHKKGNGLDFTISPSTQQDINNVNMILLGYVAGDNAFRFINEYDKPTKSATAKHFHISYGVGTEGIENVERANLAARSRNLKFRVYK
jgi:hypothetical protein